ncbi:MAG: hypothetical protein HYW10_05460, partial [Candidatus Omnitrophica bacterium]|nr:hypothetical protein [Candidatus Omnitrophota bacterium]
MKKTSRWDQRGQNIAEYAILFAVVIAAFAAMQVYAKRGLQARIKSGTDALTSITTTIQAPTGATGTGGGTGGTGGAGGTGGGTPAITPATFA